MAASEGLPTRDSNNCSAAGSSISIVDSVVVVSAMLMVPLLESKSSSSESASLAKLVRPIVSPSVYMSRRRLRTTVSHVAIAAIIPVTTTAVTAMMMIVFFFFCGEEVGAGPRLVAVAAGVLVVAVVEVDVVKLPGVIVMEVVDELVIVVAVAVDVVVVVVVAVNVVVVDVDEVVHARQATGHM